MPPYSWICHPFILAGCFEHCSGSFVDEKRAHTFRFTVETRCRHPNKVYRNFISLSQRHCDTLYSHRMSMIVMYKNKNTIWHIFSFWTNVMNRWINIVQRKPQFDITKIKLRWNSTAWEGLLLKKYKFSSEMATSSCFHLKSGFPKAPLQNAVGRYVCQLQRITLKFCKSHGSSKGTRYYMTFFK